MGKQSRRSSRRNRAPREVRYSASGEVRTEVMDDGSKQIHLTGRTAERVREDMAMMADSFRARFGRDPGPDDPLVWDPDAPGDEPVPMSRERLEAEMVVMLRQAGIREEFVYAYQQTGMFVTEENEGLWSTEQLDEFYGAMERYRRLHG